MCLLITVFAAVIATFNWYKSEENRILNIGLLCWLFWGASLMWFVDAIVEYIELGAEYFTPAAEDMLNDLFLGLSVIALALVIWIVTILIKDPKKTLKNTLLKRNN